MGGKKKESRSLHWLKSVFQGRGRSSSSEREGKTAGASSLLMNIAPGSAVSLPSRSSRHDSSSLTLTGLAPTDAQSIHAAIIPGASPIIPEQLLQSRRKDATAPENAKTNTKGSQPSTHSVVGGRHGATLLGIIGPTLLIPPSTAEQELDSAFADLAGPAKPKDGTGLTEELHLPGKQEPSTHGAKGPTTNLTPPVSPPPEPNKDILDGIHVTIEEIKSAQKVLEQKKWYYTDRHGKKVNVGERMRRILKSVEDCAKIVDIAIQHNPDISSLVWAGARFILMVALNGVQFMDNLEAAMVTIVEKMATCEFYAQIYEEGLRVRLANSTTTEAFDDGLDAALKDLYAAVRAFLDKAKEYFDPENSVTKKIVNQLKPFSVTMQPLIQDILDKEQIVEKYAGMATMERIKEDSGRLKQVHDVIMQIREEMKPLAKLDEILNVAKDVRETLVEFQTQIVQVLQPHQREMLTPKSLDSELQELKTKYLAESQQTDIFHANLYVPAQGMAKQNAPEEEHFDLWERLENFMAPETPQRVCLIQGAAGAGKSTFNHYLATRLWEAYDKDTRSSEDATRPIPVFIPLANLHDAKRHNQDLVAELFRRRKWPEERILKARELQFVFILDGYDEIEKRDRNFYIDNRLEDWNAKTVITSRPEYLGPGYQTKFYPPGQPTLLQEYWLAPFSTKDITEYISKYVEVITAKDQESPDPDARAPSRSISVKDYEKLVERPELRALISNPFLLKMVMTIQPSTGETELRRVTLYRKFLDHWLSSAQERLSRIQLPPALAGPFNTLCEENFISHAEAYCLGFAVELYRHQSLEACYFPNPGRSTSKMKGNMIWGEFLANEDPKKRLLRYSSPLVRVGESYRFLHKSLRDFAVAQSMLQDEPLCEPNTLLNEFSIVDEYGIIDFIIEEAEQNEELQAQLLACVEESKQNPGVATAAANAITILVRAGKQFHGYDLRGIRIPGADIRSGLFCGAQLQAADLSRARLDRLWLSGADLTGACIDDGEFGEKPYFRLEGTDIKPLTCFHTPDGELLVASTHHKDVQVWSATNRKLLHTFKGHTHRVTCVAFLPKNDCDHLASGSGDKTVRLWSWQNQDVQLVHMFKGHNCWVHSIAFSPDAKFLASGGTDNVVCLWSVTTHSLIHSFSCSPTMCYSLAFSPGGQALASAGDSNIIELWSTEHGKLLHTLQGHKASVRSIAFSPDGQILVSASEDNSLKFWEVSDGQLIHTFHTACKMHVVAFAPDGQMVATYSRNSIQIWSLASRKLVHGFEALSLSGSTLTFSSNSKFIVAGTIDGTIRQWLVPGAVISDAVRVGNGRGYPMAMTVNGLAFSNDKKLLACVSNDKTVRLWSMCPPHKPTLSNVLALPGDALAVTFSPGSAFLVTGTRNNVRVHRSIQDKTRSSRSQDSVFSAHSNGVETVAIAPDGNILASGGRDNQICLWSIQSGTKIHTLEGHTGVVQTVDFSPNGQLLVSGGADGTARLWSIPCRKMLHIYKVDMHVSWVNHVAFSPDGETVASASNDKTVRLWSIPDRKSLHIFEGHTNFVTRVAFSPDGFLLASGSLDRTMRFWSLSSRELVLNIDVQNKVEALAWTSTGSTSAASGLIALGTVTGVQLLQVIQKQGYSRENPSVEVSWLWATDYGIHLNVFGARIAGVTGLSPTNIELLKQRGAVGEPVVDRVQQVEEEK